MEQKKEVHDEEEPDKSGEMIKSAVNCALAIGECLQQGIKVVNALRNAGIALKKRRNAPDLKIVKRATE